MVGKRQITPETEAQIIARYVETGRSSIVAREFGIDRKTVTTVVRRNGAQVLSQQIASGRRPLDTTPLHGKIAELRASGLSQQKVASVVGVSQAVVARALRKMGLPTVKRLTGENHPMFKGGRVLSGAGYVLVMADMSDHIAASMSNRSGYVLEHRLVMAQAIGRPLMPHETVHHINGDGKDNRIENLQLRQGRHGKGVVMVCCNCGSHNIKSARIAY